MANLEKLEILIPETHSISTRATVLSNYTLTKQVNEKGDVIRRTRTFEVSMGEMGIMSFSQIIPSNNPAAEAAIMGIHSGDSFRIGHRGVTPAKDTTTTPSGMPKSGRAVKGYFNSPIILWPTFIKQEQNSMYEGVEFPDLSDRAAVGERTVNFAALRQETTPANEQEKAQTEEEMAY